MTGSEHLVPIGSGWSLWRSVCLRSAGFPANAVLELAPCDLGAAADAYLDAEAALSSARGEALRCCEAASGAELDIASARALGRAIRQLRDARMPQVFAPPPAARAALAELWRAAARLDDARREWSARFASAVAAAAESIRRVAGDASFRSAVLWQNPAALRGTIDSLLASEAGRSDSKTRERERLIASYLQRYCVKNDTIGFFGPVGWARLTEASDALQVRPGPSLLAARRVYFEAWGVDALAAAFARVAELRHELRPRLSPALRLDGSSLSHASGRTRVLPLEFARAAAACDGTRSAREIARSLRGDPQLALHSDAEAIGLLEELAENRAVLWDCDLPGSVPDPERHLAAALQAMPASEARSQALAALAELELQRSRIAAAAAAEDPAALEQSLGDLETRFSAATGLASVRRGGQSYAGRTLVYEDCQRDVDVEIGRPLLEALAPPLRLLLASARWYTYTIAREFKDVCLRAYRELAPAQDGSALEFSAFWHVIEKHFSGSQYTPSPIVARVKKELQERWREILGCDGVQGPIVCSAAQLMERVQCAFAAPHPGWPGARYHSPDLLIAARGSAGIGAGEYLAILGELHSGDNTTCNGVFVNQHPAAQELIRAVEFDLPMVRILPVIPRERSTRADQISIARHDFDLEVGSTRSRRARDHVLPISAFVVEEGARGELTVRTREGRHRFDLCAFLEHNLKLESLAHFSVLPAAPHDPRVTLDGLVVARETWRVPCEDAPFAKLADPLERFLALRRWARARGLPRFLFARIPEEVKPCYVDLDSPVYADLLVRLVRRGSRLTLTEMLPRPDELWLHDAAGRGYTSELRLVAVDAEPWRPG